MLFFREDSLMSLSSSLAITIRSSTKTILRSLMCLSVKALAESLLVTWTEKTYELSPDLLESFPGSAAMASESPSHGFTSDS